MKVRFSMGRGLLLVMLMTILVATASSPMPVRAEDGEYLWAISSQVMFPFLYKMRLDGSVVESIQPLVLNPPNPLLGPIGGLAFDGEYLWAISSQVMFPFLYKMRLDGSVVESIQPLVLNPPNPLLGPIGGLEFQPAPTPPTPVGGVLIPVGKAEILAPWIGVALATVALTVFVVKRRRS